MELTEVLKGSAAESFVKFVKYDLENISKTFFDIGFRLWEARDLEYYKELGYESIEELSENEFDFKRSSTYNLINVFTRFSVWDGTYRNQIQERFKDYSYSQLVELTKVQYLPAPHLHDWFPPSAPVREFSAYVRYYKDTTQDRLKFAEWREQVYLPRLASCSAVQLALPEVQTSGKAEEEHPVSEVQTSGQVEEENTAPEVQTSGSDYSYSSDLYTDLAFLVREACSSYGFDVVFADAFSVSREVYNFPAALLRIMEQHGFKLVRKKGNIG